MSDSEVLGSESAVVALGLVDETAAALTSATPSRVGLVSLLVDVMEERKGRYGFDRYTLRL
jgi:hypothetical protein